MTPELLAPRSLQPPAGPRPAVPRGRRDRPRHRAGGQRAARCRRSAAPAHSRRRRRSCSSRRPATGPRSGRRRRAPSAIAAPSTRSVIARCPTRCFRRSTRPTATSPACAASRSNTPLQALTTLNEPIFLECARALALRTVREGGGTDSDRLDYAFRRCLARPARPRPEISTLLELLHRQARRFESPAPIRGRWRPTIPKKPPQLPAGVTPAQLAAWTAVARVLLNLDETITEGVRVARMRPPVPRHGSVARAAEPVAGRAQQLDHADRG